MSLFRPRTTIHRLWYDGPDRCVRTGVGSWNSIYGDSILRKIYEIIQILLDVSNGSKLVYLYVQAQSISHIKWIEYSRYWPITHAIVNYVKKARPIEKLNDWLFFRVSAIFSNIDWIVHFIHPWKCFELLTFRTHFLCTKVCFRLYFCTMWFWETYSSFLDNRTPGIFSTQHTIYVVLYLASKTI